MVDVAQNYFSCSYAHVVSVNIVINTEYFPSSFTDPKIDNVRFLVVNFSQRLVSTVKKLLKKGVNVSISCVISYSGIEVVISVKNLAPHEYLLLRIKVDLKHLVCCVLSNDMETCHLFVHCL